MTLIHAECERVIGAPAETVYAFLADYRDHHPHILPTDNFFDVTVLEGDVGGASWSPIASSPVDATSARTGCG